MTGRVSDPAIGLPPDAPANVGVDAGGWLIAREHPEQPLVRVLICEAEPLLTAGLRVSMQDTAIEVAGTVQTGRQLLTWATRHDVDVALIGTSYPVRSGAEISAIIRQLTCGIAIILDSSDHERFLSFLQAGIRGFISASTAVTEVSGAVQSVARNHAYLSPVLTVQLLDWLAERVARPVASDSATSSLSPRELEVLRLLGRGSTNADISKALRIRETTVRSHVYHILTKLNLRGRSEAVLYGFQFGLQNVDEPPAAGVPMDGRVRSSRR